MNEKNEIYKITLLNDYGDKLCELKAKDCYQKYDGSIIIVDGKTVENKIFHILTAKHSVIIEEE